MASPRTRSVSPEDTASLAFPRPSNNTGRLPAHQSVAPNTNQVANTTATPSHSVRNFVALSSDKSANSTISVTGVSWWDTTMAVASSRATNSCSLRSTRVITTRYSNSAADCGE
ncbi:hypothetical protein FRX94_04995 [Corynebacterium canis]|uniref:Uncharacterized protein n=1 Tax=Corynebacterium canis TaxID=679663 RepID=A0A5C5ULE7_9CORY|nr:hypothetical protein FRX94_04995 [Corynebacterium canis]